MIAWRIDPTTAIASAYNGNTIAGVALGEFSLRWQETDNGYRWHVRVLSRPSGKRIVSGVTDTADAAHQAVAERLALLQNGRDDEIQ